MIPWSSPQTFRRIPETAPLCYDKTYVPNLFLSKVRQQEVSNISFIEHPVDLRNKTPWPGPDGNKQKAEKRFATQDLLWLVVVVVFHRDVRVAYW